VTTHATAKAPPVEDPYVGLTYFTEEYVEFFFGRDNESALIIGNLRASRLTLLYAESGVGKSSVLRAGVVARLHDFAERDRQGSGHPRLVPVVFGAWSERPIVGLVHAIGEAIRPYMNGEDLPGLPEDDLEAALEAASQALDATLLVILDQFEEYFLYPDEAPEQDQVAAQVARCVNRPDLRANFLISIREDSYAGLGDLFRGKVSNVYGNFLHLDFLDRAGAREAIEGPIERFNELRPGAEPLTIEPALVDAVLDQVRRDETDRIETTYLQLVMRRLWEEEAGAGSHVLRLQTLERLGGTQAIISSHLDRAMEGGTDGSPGLTPDQRRIAARIFRFLVTSGGTKIALTAVDLAELSALSTAEIEPVLRHLSSPQLHILRPVVFQEEGSEPRYEIFHDALAEPIREWRSRVEEAERKARRERERAEKEEAQRAAAEAERRAAQERRRKRVAQALLAVAVLALLVGAAVFAVKQKNLADQREADGQSVLASERIGELAQASDFGPAAAALASIGAYELSATPEARNQALSQLQLNVGLPKIAVGHTRGVETVAYWPDSNGKFASGGLDGTVRLWDADGNELGSPLLSRSGAAVEDVTVSPPTGGGDRIVAAEAGGEVELWKIDAAGHAFRLPQLPPSKSEYWAVAFDPRIPGLLAVGSRDGRLDLWSLKDPTRPRPVGHRPVGREIEDLAFTPNGRRLFVASSPGAAFAVSAAGFGAALSVHPGVAETVAAAANGSYAFSLGNEIKLWDAARKRELRLQMTSPYVNGLVFAAGGSVLVSADQDWNVTTWDVASGRPFGPPRMFDRRSAADVAVSPDGQTIASAGGDRLIKLWPLRAAHPLAMAVGALSPGEAEGYLPEFRSLAVGAGGQAVAATAPSGTTIWSLRHLWNPNAVPRPLARIKGTGFAVAYHGNVLVVAKGKSFAVYETGSECPSDPKPCLLAVPPRPYSQGEAENLAFARYGSRLVLASTGYRGGQTVFNLWDLTDVEKTHKIAHLSSHPIRSEVFGLALNPTKKLLAVGTRDGKLRVWDISDPREPRGVEIPHAHGNENQPVEAISFSHDGSLLATGGEDQQVVLWRVASSGSGIQVKAIPGALSQSQSILSLTFSSDGKTLAAGDAEGVTCLYQVANRSSIGVHSCLVGHPLGEAGGVESVKFAHLGHGETVLLTAGTGQPILAWKSILWNLEDSDGVDQAIANDACALASRNLTSDEWNNAFASTNLAGDRRQTCPEFP